VERNAQGHWLPGRSANPGGRPGVPEVIKATLRELSPRAVQRLGELLDSEDERIQLEAAKGDPGPPSRPTGNSGRSHVERGCSRRSSPGADRAGAKEESRASRPG